MPKDDIDYSNTIIYKIMCNDKSINDVYVGHTTNFTKRKYLHKSACANLDNKLKIYDIIRQNGDWDNWDMVEIAIYNCKDKTEARIKEQQHYEELKSTLNSSTPCVDKKTYFCIICNLQCNTPKSYETHINCDLHKKKIIEHNGTNLEPKTAILRQCISCHFKCSKNVDWDRHISTAKHQNRTNLNNLEQKNAEKSQPLFVCKNCNKSYNARNSLWYHEKKCNTNTNENNLNNIDITDSNIIIQLIKQNDEFKHLLVEQSKAMIEQNKTIIELSKNSSITNNTTHTNSHNKTFNLQFFLNETCKDAMNIMDFVDSIKLQLCDLENVGKLGYVDGISKIIVRNLNSLDETKRPVHCTDSKREVMYVKDEDKWEKENENKQKMRKVIKHVTHKNSKLLKEFKTKYPGCEKSESKFSDKYDKLIIEAMGGKGDNDIEKEDKIIRNIAKTVTIEKYNS
jgi:hypothetical protein